ncbi:MAG: glycosyltransferase [Alsobacter sp.]
MTGAERAEPPKVSVVICTRNRAYAIVNCLAAIDEAARRVSPVVIEVVVADNGSIDDTTAVVQRWAEQASVLVRVEHEDRAGIPIAKNRGLRAARGEILVLTDDDCRMAPDYFVELLRLFAHDASHVALRGGRVELGNPGDLPLTIKTEPDVRHWHISERSAHTENLGNCFLGCNLFMHRSVYEALGPFDERFGVGAIPAGEDTDYIFRAYEAGFRLEYHPNLVVEHFHGRSKPEQARKLWEHYMIGSGALYAKHLFKCPSLCLQAKWDIKSLVNELLTGKNLFLPEYGFSYATKFRCYAKGATSFLFASGPAHSQEARR